MNSRIAVSGTEYPYRPLDELFDIAMMLGVANLELWIPHNFKYEEIGRVGKALESKRLRTIVVSTWTQLNLQGDVTPRQTLINQSILAAKALGAGFVNTYFGANAQRTPQEALCRYRESILPCLEVAAKEGIVITLENEFEVTGTDCTRRADWIRELIETVNSPFFRVNFDACNFYFAGEEPFPYAYELLKDYIAYVHLKDGMKYNPKVHTLSDEQFLWKDHSGDYLCCRMGQGAINYEGLFEAFLRDGYRGCFTLEPHVPPPQLQSVFSQSLGFVTSHLHCS